ncbi:5'-3' exonuclease [Evansella clarkii]|uniref:5'-3' exonuclease n=1 Tax=Evansella clarkii TaxID=79879 RepID=UPI001FD42676|nr:5'-3' exonuclease H3TH domain-containing protein [Evansella clarkii]
MQHFVQMASHKASPKTFEAEINSLSRVLSRQDKNYSVANVEIKNHRLIVTLSTDIARNSDTHITSTSQGDIVQLKSSKLIGLDVNSLIELLNSMKVKAYKQQRKSLLSANVIDGSLILSLKKVMEAEKKTTTTNDNLLLIDGANLLSRGYFATSFRGKLLQNQEGLYTNGVYVFIKKLLRLIKQFNTNHVVVCWDVGRSETFRRKIYPEYKGLRGETEPELKQQFETTEEALKMMNIPQLKMLPYEADDLIGALSKKWTNITDKGSCYIYSSDKDLFQLLDENKRIIQVLSKNKEDIRFSADSFETEYGIKPSQWIDVKALLGETGKSSDNIPGCKGVGEKAALPLVQQYKGLDGIYENLENFDKKFKRYSKKLEDGRSDVELSKKLVTIVRDIPELPNDFSSFILNINRQGTDRAFKWLNFNNI